MSCTLKDSFCNLIYPVYVVANAVLVRKFDRS